MKTTLDLPDELLVSLEREAKRRSVRPEELVAELVQAGLEAARRDSRSRPLTEDEAQVWLADLQNIGADIYAKSVDDRSLVEIVIQDRR